MLRVRLAKPGEETRVEELARGLDLEVRALPASETWVLEEGGQLIGMARLTDLGPGYFLSSVGIIPERRGQGLGRKLVLELLAARKKKVYLYTIIPGFFHRCGFKTCPPPSFLPPRSLFGCRLCRPDECLCLEWEPAVVPARRLQAAEEDCS